MLLSEYLEGRIDDFLGHPSNDPHGSPIPGPDGSIHEPTRLRLSDLLVGFLSSNRRGRMTANRGCSRTFQNCA